MKNEEDGVPGLSRLRNAFRLGKEEGKACLVSAKSLTTPLYIFSI